MNARVWPANSKRSLQALRLILRKCSQWLQDFLHPRSLDHGTCLLPWSAVLRTLLRVTTELCHFMVAFSHSGCTMHSLVNAHSRMLLAPPTLRLLLTGLSRLAQPVQPRQRCKRLLQHGTQP